ncbi:hypothetical protein NQ315_006915 [Exocentrus adspersus]|uniref:Uncharacterized protein n=1 Tax=Exocentrus adspersus TaxID=1586481 RepID=A0AAV8WCT1_9CUCU|nr:hypothetical protein NQ315_006915 [Exocentrus adspersus]
MYRYPAVSVALLLFLNLVHGVEEKGNFSLVLGNCSLALARDMVYHEHIHKNFVLLVERNATSSWYGDQRIYCLKALNENKESEGGIAFIKEGGIGHNFVTIEMHSKRGNKMDYDVQIYGK